MPLNSASARAFDLVPADCAVVVVNFNGASHTIKCIEALARLKRRPGQLVVVDNGSEQEDFLRLQDGWRRVASDLNQPEPILWKEGMPWSGERSLLMSLADNGGFSAGNNAALALLLRASDSRAFWLVNSDAEPAPMALEALCERMNRRPYAGICGSTVVYARDPGQLQCAAGGIFISYLAATRHLGSGAPVEFLPDSDKVEEALDYVIGASFFMRREVLETVGLLGEDYFLYGEDVDYCLLAQRAGFALAWARESIVAHYEGGSTGANTASSRSAWIDFLSVRNRFHLVRKFYPLMLPFAVLAGLVILINRVRRGQADRIPMLLRAVCDGVSGHFGRVGCS
jgi:GT2 family glycosyltransferase